MKVALFGNKVETEDLLVQLVEHEGIEATVVTLEPERRLKGDISGASDKLEAAARAVGAGVFHPAVYSLSSKLDLDFFECERFDLGLTYGWQRLIPTAVLSSFSNGVFGWHGSPFRFPYGRGRSPLNWAIRLGQPVAYHYLFRLVGDADAGDVFEMEQLEIDIEDDISAILSRAHSHVLGSAGRLVSLMLAEGELDLRSQPSHTGLFLPAISAADSILDPACMSATEALRIIRASSRPFPGSKIEIRSGDRGLRSILVWRGTDREVSWPLAAGEVKIAGDGSLTIGFVDRPIRVTDWSYEDH